MCFLFLYFVCRFACWRESISSKTEIQFLLFQWKFNHESIKEKNERKEGREVSGMKEGEEGGMEMITKYNDKPISRHTDGSY